MRLYLFGTVVCLTLIQCYSTPVVVTAVEPRSLDQDADVQKNQPEASPIEINQSEASTVQTDQPKSETLDQSKRAGQETGRQSSDDDDDDDDDDDLGLDVGGDDDDDDDEDDETADDDDDDDDGDYLTGFFDDILGGKPTLSNSLHLFQRKRTNMIYYNDFAAL